MTVLLCLPCKRAVGRAELLHNRSSCARETVAADEESLRNCVGSKLYHISLLIKIAAKYI